MDDLQQFYAEFDRAVALLPPEIARKTHVTRCEVERDGTIKFKDECWRDLASVTQEGNIALPGQAEPAGQAPKPQPRAIAQGMTDVQKGLLISVAKKVQGLDEVVAEVVEVVFERIKSLEANHVSKSLDAEAYDAMADLAERLDRIEAGLQEIADNGLRYRGYWRDGLKAKRGDTYTHDGSLWWAVRGTEDKPCHESADWQVAVRKGRDAR
ncbi:MAG TPA: hypothetical protein VM619_02505 [Luteimonas sp.]|nr:hypothetical protein [Luteimonas sp.]